MRGTELKFSLISGGNQGNAINVRMWDELSAAFDTIDLDSSVRAVVMSGDGGNFSTGMDLAVFEAISSVGAGESCDGRRREEPRQNCGTVLARRGVTPRVT